MDILSWVVCIAVVWAVYARFLIICTRATLKSRPDMRASIVFGAVLWPITFAIVLLALPILCYAWMVDHALNAAKRQELEDDDEDEDDIDPTTGGWATPGD